MQESTIVLREYFLCSSTSADLASTAQFRNKAVLNATCKKKLNYMKVEL